MPKIPSDAITVETAAEICGVKSSRMTQFIRQNRVRSVRLSPRRYLLSRAAVERFAARPRPTGKGLKKTGKSR